MDGDRRGDVADPIAESARAPSEIRILVVGEERLLEELDLDGEGVKGVVMIRIYC